MFTGFLIFFLNADSNGDGFFDEQELESLFTKEVNLTVNARHCNELSMHRVLISAILVGENLRP